MAINQIQKSFKYTFNTIFHAKIRNFLKRSLWKYLLASLVLVFGFSNLGENSTSTTLLIFVFSFLALISLSLALMFVSSHAIYKIKRKDDMEITFSENEIKIFWTYKGISETKDWNWIKSVDNSNDIYYLDLNVTPRNVIMLAKHSLSSEENAVFKKWLISNGKLKG